MLTRLCTLALLILSMQLSPLSMAATQGKLLLLGDSLGASYGVPVEQGWAKLLQQRLNQAGYTISLINASISGETTAGGFARLEQLLQTEKPQWVMIELGGNDGLRGLNLAAMKSNLEGMVELSRQYQAQPLLIGIVIPPNYGRRYREQFDQVFVDISQSKSVPLLPFLLDGVGGVDQWMQADRIHPNAGAQPIITDNVWQFLQPVLGDSHTPAQ